MGVECWVKVERCEVQVVRQYCSENVSSLSGGDQSEMCFIVDLSMCMGTYISI